MSMSKRLYITRVKEWGESGGGQVGKTASHNPLFFHKSVLFFNIIPYLGHLSGVLEPKRLYINRLFYFIFLPIDDCRTFKCVRFFVAENVASCSILLLQFLSHSLTLYIYISSLH